MTTFPFEAGASVYSRLFPKGNPYTDVLLAGAEISVGQRVLDVATGTGSAAVAAAELVRRSGTILGGDICLPMLRQAKSRVQGLPVRLVAMDGQVLACRGCMFDAVLCQSSLMFFPDPARALAEFWRVLRPGGRVAVNVSTTPERSPYGRVIGIIQRLFLTRSDAPSQFFATADTHPLRGWLATAGFRDIRVTAETRDMLFDSFDEYWDPIEAGGGFCGQAYLMLPEEARGIVREEVLQGLLPLEPDGQLRIEVEDLVGIARR